ncbi:TRAP transporter small permease [Celeribacter halophilus]|jgi:TRAP-type C4-dicarboxylate transport system permease small subunit|uniref:TRAP transporter small permease n=1 Tax=Celeribacter halophilus TaxID=576117 RepID=UPI001C0A3927|nr:TRAP transporter small permease [Celeribacter halophilus]MBU2890823.1 TRAP transporter small permease [Celeribacter halophilus]MDO6510012.1 TRAP transporter small permease [Celeribacter halophilus]
METPSLVKNLQKIIIYPSRLGGYGLLAVASMICVDTIIRKTLKISIVGSTEISGFAFAFATSVAMAFAVLSAAHIRVDIVQRLLPQKLGAALNVVAAAALFAIGAVLIWNEWLQLEEVIDFEATSTLLDLPLWIPHVLFLFGLTLFTMAALAMFIAQLRSYPGNIPAFEADPNNPFDIPDDVL